MSITWITSTKSGPGDTRQHCCTAASCTARASKASSASAVCTSRLISTSALRPQPVIAASFSGETMATRRSITPSCCSRCTRR